MNNWTRGLTAGISLVAVIAYSLAVNWSALDNPPAWDSAMTVGPAAITIVDQHFDIWAVANLPSARAGGPSTHSTSIYTMLLAGLINWLGLPVALTVGHILSIMLLGALSGATYLLARERTTPLVSALSAVVVAVLPVALQQSADLYLDLPLAVVATLTSWATLRRRFVLATGLIFFAIAIKPSAVFLLPLLLIARPITRPVKQHLVWSVLATLLCLGPFYLTIATTHRFSTGLTIYDTLPLIGSSLTLLVLTTDLFLLLALHVLVTYGRLRTRSLDRFSHISIILTASFFAAHFATILTTGTIAILPRYYLAVIPTILVSLLPLEARRQITLRRPSLLLVGLALISFINVDGRLYPQPNDDFYVLAERSTRAQTLLNLQIQGTRELIATGLPLVVERTVHFRLAYPQMGYVSTRPDKSTLVTHISQEVELPDTFAMLIERRFDNPLLAIEADAISQGYRLIYKEMTVDEFSSQLVLATRDWD